MKVLTLLGHVRDHILGFEPKQRIRLAQCSLAMLLALGSVINLHYLVWVGLSPQRPVAWWTLVVVVGFALFFIIIRTGRNLVFSEPSLALWQMVFAVLCSAAGYAIAGPGRGGVFPILIGVFMFGMHALPTRQVWRVGLMSIVVFGGTMLTMNQLQPSVFAREVEISHFFMLVILVPTVAALAGQLGAMRDRLQQQKKDLAHVLARIQDLATRDELTGLINRRHMVELLEQELQRGVRSGQTFCVALIDADDHSHLVRAHGELFGDRFLQAFSREAMTVIRISDLLSRWDDDQFLLMLSDTRTPLARLTIERLRERIQRLPIDPYGTTVAARFSIGVAEHRAGEGVTQTIERAQSALASSHADGGNRLVLG